MPPEPRRELQGFDCSTAEGAAGFVESATAILRDIRSDICSVAHALNSHLAGEAQVQRLVAAGLGQLLGTYVGGCKRCPCSVPTDA